MTALEVLGSRGRGLFVCNSNKACQGCLAAASSNQPLCSPSAGEQRLRKRHVPVVIKGPACQQLFVARKERRNESLLFCSLDTGAVLGARSDHGRKVESKTPALAPLVKSRAPRYSIVDSSSTGKGSGAQRKTPPTANKIPQASLAREFPPHEKEQLAPRAPAKHTYLLSLAALPSLAAVLYAPLAASDIVVHLELKIPDLGVAILTAAAALVWVRLFDELARRNVFERKLSRKLVHISSGLLFMLFWPVFSSNPNSRLYAALVPVANLVRLAAVGTGLLKSEDTVKAISRDGDRKELLRGPLYYVIVLIATTVCFWRQSPVGVSALALMCAGDGIADIVGRRFGRELKLPYNNHKSWAGSLAMFVTGTATALLFVSYFCNFGFYECNMMHTGLKIATIALIATIVESLPITDTLDDNVTVPLTCVAVGSLLFPS